MEHKIIPRIIFVNAIPRSFYGYLRFDLYKTLEEPRLSMEEMPGKMFSAPKELFDEWWKLVNHMAPNAKTKWMFFGAIALLAMETQEAVINDYMKKVFGARMDGEIDKLIDAAKSGELRREIEGSISREKKIIESNNAMRISHPGGEKAAARQKASSAGNKPQK